jgi:hypothetical protein
MGWLKDFWGSMSDEGKGLLIGGLLGPRRSKKAETLARVIDSVQGRAAALSSAVTKLGEIADRERDNAAEGSLDVLMTVAEVVALDAFFDLRKKSNRKLKKLL